MKKQMMTALAVSAMMTLRNAFRVPSLRPALARPASVRGNNCGYTTDTNAISMVRTQGGCVISMEMLLVFIRYLGRDIQVGGLEIIAAPAAQTASMEAAALPE